MTGHKEHHRRRGKHSHDQDEKHHQQQPQNDPPGELIQPHGQTQHRWARIIDKALPPDGRIRSFAKYCPLIAAILAPFSTLMDIPALSVSHRIPLTNVHTPHRL